MSLAELFSRIKIAYANNDSATFNHLVNSTQFQNVTKPTQDLVLLLCMHPNSL